MSTDKYEALRQAIKGATPGPWVRDEFGAIQPAPNERLLVCGVGGPSGNGKWRKAGEANADYIAAANPAAIASLLAERDALRDALEAAKNGLDWYRDRCPEASDGSDDEMDAQIREALKKAECEQ